jgi:hypothetical protein
VRGTELNLQKCKRIIRRRRRRKENKNLQRNKILKKKDLQEWIGHFL